MGTPVIPLGQSHRSSPWRCLPLPTSPSSRSSNRSRPAKSPTAGSVRTSRCSAPPHPRGGGRARHPSCTCGPPLRPGPANRVPVAPPLGYPRLEPHHFRCGGAPGLTGTLFASRNPPRAVHDTIRGAGWGSSRRRARGRRHRSRSRCSRGVARRLLCPSRRGIRSRCSPDTAPDAGRGVPAGPALRTAAALPC